MPIIVQYCLILPNIAQYCPVLFNIAKVTISVHSELSYCMEHLDILQYFPKIVIQYCPILPNIVQYCLILSNIAKYCPIVIDIAQYCPVLFNIAQVTISAHQKYAIARNIQILSNIVKFILIM